MGSLSKPDPSPLVISPLKNDQHTHTIILLHGRGSNSERFGHVFLESTGIAKHLPTVKFIFPTARKRRCTARKRMPINQWFDNYSLEDLNARPELQLDGLQESSEFLRRLIDEEAGLLSSDPAVDDGYSRVITGGLSQGCATSVFCLLGGFGGSKQLGGFVGMSGWLPLDGEISGILNIGEDDQVELESKAGDIDDPFSRDTDSDGVPAQIQAVNHIREVLNMPLFPPDNNDSQDALDAISPLKTPVFLGHGTADPKVPVDMGRRMASILSDGFGMDTTWKEYEDFGHWYKVPDEIDDVVRFLKEKAGVPVVELEQLLS